MGMKMRAAREKLAVVIVIIIIIMIITTTTTTTTTTAITIIIIIDRLCGLVVRIPSYRSRRPGSIPCATRFSEK
jgi:energy-coupling factor transporter transmembrane protein EcfT